MRLTHCCIGLALSLLAAGAGAEPDEMLLGTYVPE